MENNRGFVNVEKIEAPRGGDLYKGLGENCAVKPFSGEASLVIPLPLSPAREQTPALELVYRAGGENTVFGKGFSLQPPRIYRNTSKRIPRYDAGDIFEYGDGKELVEKDSYTESGVKKTRYGFRKEQDFTRLTFCDDGTETWWEAIDREGVCSLFGRDATSRIADPGSPRRVYAWMICESVDTKGNRAVYSYTKKGHLSEVSYGNYTDADGTVQWLLKGAFHYRERKDCVRSCRAGFMRVTDVLCERFLMYHRIDGEFTNVNALEFAYDSTGSVSVLTQIKRTGICGDRQESIELLALSYEGFDPQKACEMPILAQASPRLVMADLYGEGAAGILYAEGDDVLYAQPLGEYCFDTPKQLENFPIHRYFAKGACSLESLDADGACALVVKSDSVNGYYPLEGEVWDSFRPFASHTNEEHTDAAEYAELEGDGRRHLIILQEGGRYYPNRGTQGIGAPAACVLPPDFPRASQHDGQEFAGFVDLLGDGLSHRVRIRSGSVEYWPCLGYGRFGERMQMDHAPVFPADWKADKLCFADVDGSGTTDLIYVDGKRLLVYCNTGSGFMEPVEISLTDTVCDDDQVFFADINGSGSACMVVRRQDTGTMRGLELSAGKRPYLLRQTENLFGKRTLFSYGSAAAMYLADKRAGNPWKIHPPFPIAVLAAMEVIDAFAASRQCVEYRYRDGRYDRDERKFHGFGLVEEKKFLRNEAGGERGNEVCRRYRYYIGEEETGELPEHLFSANNHAEAEKSLYGECVREEVYALAQPDPVRVKECRYEVRELAEPSGGKRGIYAVFPWQELETVYEDTPKDPVQKHHFVLARDVCGNVLRECDLSYPRRLPEDGAVPVPDRVWEGQRQQKMKERQAEYVNLTDGCYRLGICVQEKEILREFPGRDGLLTEEDVCALLKEQEGETISWKQYFYWDSGMKQPLPLGEAAKRALLHHEEYAVLPVHTGMLPKAREEELLSDICGCQRQEDMWWQAGAVCHYYGAEGFYLPWYEEDAAQKYRTELRYDCFWCRPSDILRYEEGDEPLKTGFELDLFSMEYSRQEDYSGIVTTVAFSPLGFVESVLCSDGEEQILTEYTYDYDAWKRTGEPVSMKKRVSRADAGAELVQERFFITYWDGQGKVLEMKYPLDDGGWLVTDKCEYDGNGEVFLQFPGYETKAEAYGREEPGIWPVRCIYDYAGRKTQEEHPLDAGEAGGIEYAFVKYRYHPWHEERMDRNHTSAASAFAGGKELTFKDGMGQRMGELLLRPGEDAAAQELNAWFVHDVEGRLVGISDGRLLKADAWIMQCRYDLCGRKVWESCADSGITVTLYSSWGEKVWTMDANGVEKQLVYDSLRRHTATLASGAGMTERITYGKNTPQNREMHLAGQVWRHCDQAGVEETLSYAIGGAAKKTRVYCEDYTKAPDWSKDVALEQQAYVHEYEYDCDNNVTLHRMPGERAYVFHYDSGGQLKNAVRTGVQEDCLIQDITYQGKGRRKNIHYGGGSCVEYGYHEVSGRLKSVGIRDAQGKGCGRLTFAYDPEENLLCVDGGTESICNGGSVVRPLWEYAYDWYYRLAQAKGREAAGDEQDFQNLLPYTETYSYDDSGNLTQIKHRGSSARSFVRDMKVCPDSNRTSGIEVSEVNGGSIAASYDACGNTLASSAKGRFVWNTDNRLAQAVLIERAQDSDIEYYIYNYEGKRERKVTLRQKNGAGAEITDCRENDGFCSKTVTNKETVTKEEWTEVWCRGERLATLYERGGICFPIETHTGCIQMEADEAGQVSAIEEYYPYGGTALVRKQPDRPTERLRRFCGKEYDSNTGLYYYGARYYNPNEGRMHSPDDMEYVDEARWQTINRYLYCRGNPATLWDEDGHDWKLWTAVIVLLFAVCVVGYLYSHGRICTTRRIAPYSKLREEANNLGQQAHHLGQNAAFRNVIPRDEGLCIGLRGNALYEKGSEHYEAHKSMERFYEPYRRANTMPTIGQYNNAVYRSLRAAGLRMSDCSNAKSKMEEEQQKHGLTKDQLLPRMPAKMHQRK